MPGSKRTGSWRRPLPASAADGCHGGVGGSSETRRIYLSGGARTRLCDDTRAWPACFDISNTHTAGPCWAGFFVSGIQVVQPNRACIALCAPGFEGIHFENGDIGDFLPESGKVHHHPAMFTEPEEPAAPYDTLADEFRARANQARDPDVVQSYQNLARSYERLAQHAARFRRFTDRAVEPRNDASS